ncbi:MAG: hypothetical protein SFU25_02395 [Candidatus Caenarcaniphilales bacterium]|nr:hypothetical protein [Candidatus Caenarcaniphilales bacterium]
MPPEEASWCPIRPPNAPSNSTWHSYKPEWHLREAASGQTTCPETRDPNIQRPITTSQVINGIQGIVSSYGVGQNLNFYQRSTPTETDNPDQADRFVRGSQPFERVELRPHRQPVDHTETINTINERALND